MTIVTVVSRGIDRAIAKLFVVEGVRVTYTDYSLQECERKLFDDSLPTTVSEDLEYNLESSWRNIYG